MRKLDYAKFVIALRPALVAFARWLYERHQGDPVAAREHLRRIPDYGAALEPVEAELERQMDEADAKRRGA